MAQAYPYRYKGTIWAKQDKCRASMPLDKPGIWLDFNEFCAAGNNGEAPIYLFSQAYVVNDSDGNDVELHDGMEVSVFDDNRSLLNRPDTLWAESIMIRNFHEQFPMVKWFIKLAKNKVEYKSGAEYVYWMSDLL